MAFFHLPLAFHLFGSPLVLAIFVDLFRAERFRDRACLWGATFERPELGSFLLRRIGRLWPLHLATLAALIGFECIRYLLATRLGVNVRPPFAGETDPSLLTNALLLHGQRSIPSWNVPSWSISANCLAYIVFGLVVLLTRSRAVAAAGLIVAVTWLASVSMAVNIDLYARWRPRARSAALPAYWSIRVRGDRPPRLVAPPRHRARVRRGDADRWTAICPHQPVREMMPWAMPGHSLSRSTLLVAERRGDLEPSNPGPPQALGMPSYSIYLTHWLVITLTSPPASSVSRSGSQ